MGEYLKALEGLRRIEKGDEAAAPGAAELLSLCLTGCAGLPL
jgi:hypothetical protein